MPATSDTTEVAAGLAGPERAREQAKAPRVKSGIYLARAIGTTLHKIGKSQDIDARMKQLQTGQHRKLALVAWRTTSDPDRSERHFHALFRPFRAEGEWFDLQLHQIAELIYGYDFEVESSFSELNVVKDRAVVAALSYRALGFSPEVIAALVAHQSADRLATAVERLVGVGGSGGPPAGIEAVVMAIAGDPRRGASVAESLGRIAEALDELVSRDG